MAPEHTRPDGARATQRLPLFVDLAGKKVVVIGGGNVAASKVPALLAAGAVVTLVAPEILPEAVHEGMIIHQREFEPADLDGAWFVLSAATSEVNRAAAAAARTRRVFINAVDDPANGTAYFGGTLRRGDITIAISTGGKVPALARLLRQALDELLPPDLEQWLQLAKEQRQRWLREQIPMSERLPLLAEAVLKLYRRD